MSQSPNWCICGGRSCTTILHAVFPPNMAVGKVVNSQDGARSETLQKPLMRHMMHSENLCYQRSKASASVSVPLIAGLHYGFTALEEPRSAAALKTLLSHFLLLECCGMLLASVYE
ncbi:hypothetical protein CRYUN_Cryun03dG0035800 [Craigia yunnanensis]